MSDEAAPRYAPGRAFPAYAYLPGRDPHPTQDERGHSYRAEAGSPAEYLEPEHWHANGDYLFGVDLYNHGFLWESHESWEGLWRRARRDELQAELLRGLIQCAAACLKIPMGQPRGLARLSELGTARLERVARATGGRFMGLDLAAFVPAFRAFAASSPSDAAARPHLLLSER